MLRTPRTLAVAVATMIALLAGCTPVAEPPAPAASRDAGILLFQWTWDAIAEECATLGELGFGWVLTSPPQEHVVRDEWWVHYQPVSYLIESRLGTRDEFAAMVATCAEHEVDIVADAVVNHMTGLGTRGVGWAGSAHGHYEYPGIWGPDDFHQCTASPTGDIIDYRDEAEVQTCELINLADLRTGEAHVRERLRAYLDDLLSLGVAGFRIDAAKHMPAADIAAIVDGLPDGTRIYHEVIRGAGEPITPEQYLGSGQVWEFLQARTLTTMVESGRLNPDVVFGPDGERYAIAIAFLLAHPYGTPQLSSGYAFVSRDAGPRLDDSGAVLPATCEDAATAPQPRYEPGDWVCPQRWDAVRGMLAFRAAVGDAPLTDATEFDERELRAVTGFGRGAYGFIAFNAGATGTEATFETSLAPGRYTEAVSGDTIEVDGDGRFTAEIPGYGVVALHVGAVER